MISVEMGEGDHIDLLVSSHPVAQFLFKVVELLLSRRYRETSTEFVLMQS